MINFFTTEELNSLSNNTIDYLQAILQSVSSSYTEDGIKDWLNRPRYLLNSKSAKEVILSQQEDELHKLKLLAATLDN